jgi:hypothetical protein
MQGSQISTPIQNGKGNIFMKTLELREKKTECSMFCIFPTLERCCPSSEIEAKKKKLFINHLDALKKIALLYFKDINVIKFESVRNPFAANISRLMTCERELPIDVSCDHSLKVRFNADELLQF